MTSLVLSSHVLAAGETIDGSNSFGGLKNTQIALNDIHITGSGNPTIPVRLFVSHGSLSFTSTTGLTFEGPTTGAQIEFSGTLSNVNAALATLRYIRAAVGTDTLEVSLVDAGEVFFSENGHLYEYVSVPGTINWNNAKTAAEGREKYGSTGYLATITSLAENNFISDRLEGAGWMGASDSSVEGAWRWVTGPENGTQFWSGNGSGAIVGGRFANWNNASLANGGTGSEPNNSGDEDCGQFLAGTTGLWNDLNCSSSLLPGYVVEYGAAGDMPELASKNITITTTAIPANPTSLGATAVVNGSWGTNASPTLAFTQNDEDSGDQLRYRIQIDNTADFSSPVVDYQSGPKSQGSFNFVVGQAVGAGTSGVGTYNVGAPGQVLADGQYYWRVKAIDDAAHESSYTVARSGQVAFGVDATAPVISLEGDNEITIVQGHPYSDFGATATDAVDGDLTDDIVVTNPVDTDELSTYTVRYNVTDHVGLAASEVTRTVQVVADVDRNNDGIGDSFQDNISSYDSPITGKLVLIDVGQDCEITTDDMVRQSSFNLNDPGYSYENGLFDFAGDCGTPGFSTNIKLYYYGVTKEGMVGRKYNPYTHIYSTIPGATITQTVIDGSPVTVLSYTLTDGGPLDTDGVVNGEFTDPAGIALANQTSQAVLAETGDSQSLLVLISLASIVGGLVLLRRVGLADVLRD